jgi:acetoin utilization deacetylase AcuC-like enzyme
MSTQRAGAPVRAFAPSASREVARVSELLVVEQRRGENDASHWIREGGRTIPGRDSNLRLDALRDGLVRHEGVRVAVADADDEELERVLAAMHEPAYLDALRGVDSAAPVVIPGFAPPGLEPDIPVNAGLVAAAHEGVRTAISAAQHLAAGTHFAYAVCRPPGHHAGPDFLGGYCYLNNAAAAVRTLCEEGIRPVGILDLDLHYPNGTSALVEEIEDATLHSLHASPVTNVSAGTVLPRADGERVVAFGASPDADAYLEEVGTSIEALAASAAALVVSLGYDTVAGDPHGSWGFAPEIFAGIGRLLASSGLPVCVIQEGGYLLPVLAECSNAFARGLLDGRPA